MKKLFFIAVAVMAMAACSRTEMNDVVRNNAINFQTATSLNTKVTGAVFPTTETFGTYCWTNGTDGTLFIDNDEVAYDANHNIWTTTHNTYYWTKNGSLDFISYYPYNMEGVTIAKNQIDYNLDFWDAYAKSAITSDIMYADKAVGFTDNANEVQDGTVTASQNGYEGVPTIFRHAAAKVRVMVVLGENEKVEAATGTKTKWTVKLNKVQLTDVLSKGSCTLTLNTTPTTGIVGWTKPAGEVWTADETVKRNYESNCNQNLTLGQGCVAVDYKFMLPQALTTNQQKVYLDVDIDTARASAGEDYPTEPALHQSNVIVSTDLLIRDEASGVAIVDSWKMNQSITYTITLGPAGKQITFDPATANWENKAYDTNIELDI